MDSGSVAWMLMASALVLFMTPGLAFFYGGLVRGKNVVSTVMYSFVSMGVGSVVWVLWGYSLAFGEGGDVSCQYHANHLAYSAHFLEHIRISCDELLNLILQIRTQFRSGLSEPIALDDFQCLQGAGTDEGWAAKGGAVLAGPK